MSWDFSLLLFVLLVITAVVSLLDRLVLRKRRALRVQAAVAAHDAAARQGDGEAIRQSQLAVDRARRQPWWVEYSLSFLPVILFVFVLRSFIVEPFRIPSGSMLPTLVPGDLILVNKFDYGIRMPIVDRTVIPLGKPQRGDVIVFRYPVDPSEDYIKRIVGVPGDEIDYINKVLTINGQVVNHTLDGNYYDPDRVTYVSKFNEKLGNVDHKILLDPTDNQGFGPILQFPHFENCQYSADGVRCKVPAGYYFAMGDNRDNSADSRYWGFVPDRNIVGKAFFIWMNFSDLSRIGFFH